MTDPRVERLAGLLWNSFDDDGSAFAVVVSLDPAFADMYRSKAVQTLADLDRLAWRDLATAPPPKDGKPFLGLLPVQDLRHRDGKHGPMQVCANRGRGTISIPGMWECRPTHWQPLPPPPGKEGEG